MTMRARIIHGFAILLTALVFLMTSASVHHRPFAQEAEPTSEGTPSKRNLSSTNPEGKKTTCEQLNENGGSGAILGYIVPCIVHSIEGTTERMSEEMIDWLMPTVWSFITLVVVFFGVRILQGGGQVHVEGILLLLKIGIVIAVLELIPHTFVPMLYEVMDQSQEIVAGAISPDTSSITCDYERYRGENGELIWAQMDCLIGKLWGVTMGTTPGPDGQNQPNMLLAASVFGMMGGFLFGGSFGVVLFIACIGVLWTMFIVILRTVMAFLNGYLYACILLIIAPLFVPLILLKATAQYFEPWWKGILGSILLPIIITSYTMFAMLLYDRMMFDDGSISKEPSLMHKLFNSELVKQMHGQPRPLCNMLRPGDNTNRAASTGIAEKTLATNPFMRQFVTPLLSGANDQCMGITKPSVEMSTTFNMSNRDAFNALFHDCVKLLVLAIMISMGIGSINSLARRLTGSPGVASSLDAKGMIESKFSALQAQTKQSVISGFHDEKTGRSATGAEFITRLGSVPKSIGQGLVGELNRE